MRRILFLSAILLSITQIHTKAQCSAVPAELNCSSGTAATNGVNINSGQTYYYSGSGTFGAGVNLNGGTLIVCGTLTMNNISWNSGTIMVNHTGTLTINGSSTLYMNGSSTLVNYGSLTVNRDIVMQNSNNYIYNAASNILFSMPGKKIEMNSTSSYFINNGTAKIGTLYIQSNCPAGGVCLGSSSCIEVQNLINNKLNGVTGAGTFFYTGTAQLNTNFTSSSSLTVNQASGSNQTGPANFGSAIIAVGGTNCYTILPISLSDFTVTSYDDHVLLSWSTLSEENNEGFKIERMGADNIWETIGYVNGNGTSSQEHFYSFIDASPLQSTSYYMLEQYDAGGTSVFSGVLSCDYTEPDGITIYPNPANSEVHIKTANGVKTVVSLFDPTGRLIEYREMSEEMQLDVNMLSPGLYFIKTQDDSGEHIYPLMVTI